jgi:hypothetical protein
MLTFLRDDGRRTLYSNRNNPQTTTIGNHLSHHLKWAEKCREQGIVQKVPSKKNLSQLESVQDEPYTPDGLLHYLTRWIAVDDQVGYSLVCLYNPLTYSGQSVNVVESQEFRRLLLYCGRQIKDKHIPHRTKMADALKSLFEQMMGKWIAEVQVSYKFFYSFLECTNMSRIALEGFLLPQISGPTQIFTRLWLLPHTLFKRRTPAGLSKLASLRSRVCLVLMMV